MFTVGKKYEIKIGAKKYLENKNILTYIYKDPIDGARCYLLESDGTMGILDLEHIPAPLMLPLSFLKEIGDE